MDKEISCAVPSEDLDPKGFGQLRRSARGESQVLLISVRQNEGGQQPTPVFVPAVAATVTLHSPVAAPVPIAVAAAAAATRGVTVTIAATVRKWPRG